MALQRRYLVLAGIGIYVAWGWATCWLPSLSYLFYGSVIGTLLTWTTLLVPVFWTARRENAEGRNGSTAPSVAFISPGNWQRETKRFHDDSVYQPDSLYPQSFVVSGGIDDLLALVSRDFIASWHRDISARPAFVNEVDRIIRRAIANLRDRLLTEDLVSLIVSRIFPVVTTHLREFDIAERAVRGRNLTRNVTESEELSLAIASKYCDGKVHPAAALSVSDQKTVVQEYLRKVAVGLMPKLLPRTVLNSRIVSVLLREVLACAVLFPIVSLLSDPDTWNQLVEAYGRTALQDRKTVRKLRAALDEHASPVSRSKHKQVFPRLTPNDSERAFERFVRAIRRCNNLSDARRFRALITSQLKKESMIADQDQTYVRRLETGKRVLDQKVSKLSATGDNPRALPAAPGQGYHNHTRSSSSSETSLIDLMHDASGLSYFMEFMDRQNLMSLVQFWIVVDGFRNPLEDDFGNEMSSGSSNWTTTDRNDMALMSETYLSKPELKVSEESRRIVKAFLSAGKRATPEQYRKARTVILTTQTGVLEDLQNIYYPKFKRSDLYYKYLASDDVSSAASHKSSAPTTDQSVTHEKPERRTLPPLSSRTTMPVGSSKPKSLRRAAVTSSDSRNTGKLFDDDNSPRPSFDSERSAPLFDDDDSIDPLARSTQSLGQDQQSNQNEANQSQVIETMEAALNDIITSEPKNGKADELRGSEMSSSGLFGDSPRGSMESHRTEARTDDKARPSIASLGLVDENSRRGVFDDDLFADHQQNFIEDEYEEPEGTEEKDPADEVHEAAPGDLGLTEAIEALSIDIDKLGSQDSVVDALTRKAELTNNTAELRILHKSKTSIQREVRRKEMQRQQYIIQESDNSLYGRSSIQIKSIVVGREEDGHEFAMCMLIGSLFILR